MRAHSVPCACITCDDLQQPKECTHVAGLRLSAAHLPTRGAEPDVANVQLPGQLTVLLLELLQATHDMTCSTVTPGCAGSVASCGMAASGSITAARTLKRSASELKNAARGTRRKRHGTHRPKDWLRCADHPNAYDGAVHRAEGAAVARQM